MFGVDVDFIDEGILVLREVVLDEGEEVEDVVSVFEADVGVKVTSKDDWTFFVVDKVVNNEA